MFRLDLGSLVDTHSPWPLNPRLGPLADNGGSTLTHALLSGSPAINAGDNTGAPATDQRGWPRIACGTTDIGAFEWQYCDQVTITTIAMLPGPECSLRGTVVPGSNFRLETSTDLVHWTVGGAVVAAPDGSFECHLPAPIAEPARFYRLRSP